MSHTAAIARKPKHGPGSGCTQPRCTRCVDLQAAQDHEAADLASAAAAMEPRPADQPPVLCPWCESAHVHTPEEASLCASLLARDAETTLRHIQPSESDADAPDWVVLCTARDADALVRLATARFEVEFEHSPVQTMTPGELVDEIGDQWGDPGDSGPEDEARLTILGLPVR